VSDPAERGQRKAERRGLSSRLSRGLAIVGVLLVAVYSALLVYAGGQELLVRVAAIEPPKLVLPILATLASYLAMSFSYDGIARAAGAVIPLRETVRITFIANTANYVLPSGGLTGFALRLVFFRRKGVLTGRAIAISFTQTLITNLMLMVFIVYGMANLLLRDDIGGVTLAAAWTLAGGLGLVILVSLAMVYNRRVRNWVINGMGAGTDRLLALTGYHGHLADRARAAIDHLADGMELFAARPTAMVVPSAWIFLDWLFMIGVLYLGFLAVGYDVSPSVVIIAFSISIVLAVASFVPGGAGVLDGVLALSFDRMGVPVHDSLLPIFLYRLCYFLLPALLSLALARGAFAEAETEVTEELL
jgi:uncharacterized protein (TIRG00374 family)